MRQINSITWFCGFICNDYLFTELAKFCASYSLSYFTTLESRDGDQRCSEGGLNCPSHPTLGFVHWCLFSHSPSVPWRQLLPWLSHVLLCELNMNAWMHPFTLFSSEEKVQGSACQREHRASLLLTTGLVLTAVRHWAPAVGVLHCVLLTPCPPHSAQTEMLGDLHTGSSRLDTAQRLS